MRQKDRRKTENIKFCWRRQRLLPQHTFGGKQRGSKAEDYENLVGGLECFGRIITFFEYNNLSFLCINKSQVYSISSHIWNHQPGVGIHIFWGHDFRAQRYQSQCIRHALIRGNAKKRLGTMALDAACWQALKNIRSYMFWGTTRKNKIDADFGSDMEQIWSS